jgi:hypothetical protein
MCDLDLIVVEETPEEAELEGRTTKGTAIMDTTAPVLKIAKAFADTGRSFMSEHDLTKMIEQYALRDRRSGETQAQCFARVVCADTAEGLLFRKALAVCRSVGVTPRGGDDVDAAQAYRKLEKLADRERAADPRLTSAQAFSKVFTDPANAELATRAAPRPQATTSFPYPR